MQKSINTPSRPKSFTTHFVVLVVPNRQNLRPRLKVITSQRLGDACRARAAAMAG